MADTTFNPPHWPAGHRAALCISIDVDAHYGEANYRDPLDTSWISQASYDATGTRRLLRLLADTDTPATFFWVGRAAEDNPQLVQAAAQAGHEIALHTWDHKYLNEMTETEQRADFERTIEAITRISGTRPTGHKRWQRNATTWAIAQELGLSYVMDEPDGDYPSLHTIDPTKRPLVNLPPSWMWDDYNWYVDRMTTPSDVFSAWRDDLDVIRAEGGMMCLTLHPFVSGRPGPSSGLARFIDYAIDLGDIWIARGDHIARWWLERAR